jgi:SAM-dependent methyltransferase
MSAYDALARFYDPVQGDRADAAAYARAQLPDGVERVLELACGTGSILAHLRVEYEVVGVDLSPQMLEIAAEKLPGIRLVQGDMTSIRLGECFDAVLCLYDSINHLLRFEDWERLFDTAAAHLVAGGVFVFDMYTIVIDVTDGGGGVRDWMLRVFEHVAGDEYRLAEETIHEIAFPAERVRAKPRGALRERRGARRVGAALVRVPGPVRVRLTYQLRGQAQLPRRRGCGAARAARAA